MSSRRTLAPLTLAGLLAGLLAVSTVNSASSHDLRPSIPSDQGVFTACFKVAGGAVRLIASDGQTE